MKKVEMHVQGIWRLFSGEGSQNEVPLDFSPQEEKAFLPNLTRPRLVEHLFASISFPSVRTDTWQRVTMNS